MTRRLMYDLDLRRSTMMGVIARTGLLSAWLGAALLAQPAVQLSDTQAPREVTFSKDIAPIFERACQNCHRPGSIAPMSLLNYKDARPWARSIKQKVVTRVMPPWHIDRNIGVAKFKDDPSLS